MTGDRRYTCPCGATFPLDLGKYGCPNCCGESGPAIVNETRAKSPKENC